MPGRAERGGIARLGAAALCAWLVAAGAAAQPAGWASQPPTFPPCAPPCFPLGDAAPPADTAFSSSAAFGSDPTSSSNAAFARDGTFPSDAAVFPGGEPVGWNTAIPAMQTSATMHDSRAALLEERLAALEQQLTDGKSKSDEAESRKPTQHWSGRIHAAYWAFPGSDDGANFFETGDSDEDVADRFLFRRLRLGLAGDVPDNMEYKIEFDFAPGNDG